MKAEEREFNKWLKWYGKKGAMTFDENSRGIMLDAFLAGYDYREHISSKQS